MCSPPPSPDPFVQVFEETPQAQSLNENIPLKNLQQSDEYAEKSIVNVTIIDNGVSEEHEIKITTSNLENGYFPGYTIFVGVLEEESLNIISNECYKTPLSNNEEDNICTPINVTRIGNQYNFTYKFKLYKDENIIIKQKYEKTKKYRDILYRQVSVSIPQIYPKGNCEYKFIIPEGYANLGLQNNIFKKDPDNNNIYYYKENCPNEQINEVIRITPKESYWKAEDSYGFEFTENLANNITLIMPRFYRGGKNKNKNYKITTYENEALKESVFIYNETLLKIELPGKNNKKVGINLHTAFSNKIEDKFDVYTSENYFKLENNIDDAIKNKAQEIINDQNSQYKDYPDYYKIGRFVHSYIEYTKSYHGKNLTALEIFNQKKGVCEHFTILYNAMLNSIGIKTFSTFGWSFDQNITSKDENSETHAWTVAFINNEWVELDATWDLFEGIPAGHVFKGFNKESLSYSYKANSQPTLIKTKLIQLIDNLDNEEEDNSQTTDVRTQNDLNSQTNDIGTQNDLNSQTNDVGTQNDLNSQTSDVGTQNDLNSQTNDVGIQNDLINQNNKTNEASSSIAHNVELSNILYFISLLVLLL